MPSTHAVSNAFWRSTKATNVRVDLRDDKTSRNELTQHPIGILLADVEMGRDERSNAEMDQMLEEFEAARLKRDGAIVGGETGVAPCEDGHNNAPFPQSGKTRLKKLSKARCHQRTLNKEHGTPSRRRIHANPQSATQL